MQDAELVFRDGSTDLEADMSVVYLDLGAPTTGKEVVRVIVPEMAETDDLINPIIHLSVDGSGDGERQLVCEPITKAGVDGGRTQYFYSLPRSPYQYVGLELDVVDDDSGSDFSAGAVEAYLGISGQYNDF
jgi:hypothetical protein